MNWNNVTTEQYSELLKIFSNKELTAGQVNEKILKILSLDNLEDAYFIREDIPSIPKPSIGKYKVDFMKDLKVAEYVDASMTLKEDPYDFGQLLAILCRKDGELYDDKFIATKLEDRITFFNNLPITITKPVIDFFINRANQFLICSQKSLMEIPKSRFALRIVTLLGRGLLKGCFMNTVRALLKLRKLARCTLPLSQNM